MIYKCPWCGKTKRGMKNIKLHVHEDHTMKDYKARWVWGL